MILKTPSERIVGKTLLKIQSMEPRTTMENSELLGLRI